MQWDATKGRARMDLRPILASSSAAGPRDSSSYWPLLPSPSPISPEWWLQDVMLEILTWFYHLRWLVLAALSFPEHLCTTQGN